MPATDEDDDFEMLPEYDFSNAKRGPAIPSPGKTRITMMLDRVVLKHFRDEAEREGRGYQTAINMALREWIKAQKRGVSVGDDRPATVADIKRLMREAAKR